MEYATPYPQINYISCSNLHEKYRMFYTGWGKIENCHKTLLCLHGLNRNGRDFDYVANYFVNKGYYVIAPDIVGRGNSDYLADFIGYDFPYYVNDIATLIKALALPNVSILGTSMGGIIGMLLASGEDSPVQKLILNDIGAEIELSGLSRISQYSVNNPEFDNYAAIKKYILDTSHEFGFLPEDVWEQIIRNGVQKNLQGRYELKRDVNISKLFKTATSTTSNISLWEYWQTVNVTTLIIHGEKSDILTQATINKMQQLKPHTKSITISGSGHAPYLYSGEHCSMLYQFLKE